MQNQTKYSKTAFWIINSVVFVIFTILMVIATRFDLQISKEIADGSSFFADFFAIVGELPAYMAVPVSGVIIFFNATLYNKKSHRVLLKILGLIAVFGGWFFWFYAGTKLTESVHLVGFSVFWALSLGLISLWIGSLVKVDTMNKLFKYAVFMLVFTLVTLAVIQISKNIWCRMRYRDMLKEGNFDGFTPWYEIVLNRENPNPDYHYTSFPSGHTSSACHIFLICVLCDIFPSLNKKSTRIIMNTVSVAFTVIVAISRIVDEAHFLSDVLVGGYLTYIIFAIMRYLFFGKGKYNYDIALHDNNLQSR